MEARIPYRAEVDGLRAVAVVAVLLFHLRVPGFEGGYVGVDVFFVISGYLITGLLRAELDAGSFSLRRFYLRRVRRLGPALLLVTAPTALVAWLLLLPEDLRSFGGSLVTQALSLQNIAFLAEGEYFRGADTKLLLHTWSLAVEEQFYLFWPLLLLALRRSAPARRLGVVGALVVASFCLNLALMRLSPKASFFLLPPRAWELGVGGALALLEREGHLGAWLGPGRRAAAGVAGFGAVAASVVGFTAETPFPGYAAALPVAGSALLLVGSAGPVQRALAHPAVVRVGLISYPLYLWHWPLLAVAVHVQRGAVSAPVRGAILLAAPLLAELTYRLVETPIRRGTWLPSARGLLLAVGIALGGLTAFGAYAVASQGAPSRYPAAARPFVTAAAQASSERCGFRFRVAHPRAAVCALVPPAGERRVLLWGNSHADMWSGLFRELARERGAGLYLSARNCRATPDSAFCGRPLQAAVLDALTEQRVTDVVLASSWYGEYGVTDPVFEAELARVVDELAARGPRVWLVIDVPKGPELDPIAAYLRAPRAPEVGWVPPAAHLPERARERALFERLARAHPGVAVLDPTPALCEARGCPGGRDGAIWYRDSNHLTHAGARVARTVFEPVFDRPSGQASPPSAASPGGATATPRPAPRGDPGLTGR